MVGCYKFQKTAQWVSSCFVAITNRHPQDKNICANTVRVETCHSEASSFPGLWFPFRDFPVETTQGLSATAPGGRWLSAWCLWQKELSMSGGPFWASLPLRGGLCSEGPNSLIIHVHVCRATPEGESTVTSSPVTAVPARPLECRGRY